MCGNKGTFTNNFYSYNEWLTIPNISSLEHFHNILNPFYIFLEELPKDSQPLADIPSVSIIFLYQHILDYARNPLLCICASIILYKLCF